MHNIGVLSVAKLTPGQERCYEQSVAAGIDDYYAGRGESPGVWVGRGARDARAPFATVAPAALRNAETLEEGERRARVENGFPPLFCPSASCPASLLLM